MNVAVCRIEQCYFLHEQEKNQGAKQKFWIVLKKNGVHSIMVSFCWSLLIISVDRSEEHYLLKHLYVHGGYLEITLKKLVTRYEEKSVQEKDQVRYKIQSLFLNIITKCYESQLQRIIR